MKTQIVGMREFRDNLATYLLESEAPLAITRHGDTVGYFVPSRRKRKQVDWAALDAAATQLQASMAAAGVNEDDVLQDFKRLRSKPK